MGNIENIVGLVQWGVFFFFITVHYVIGFVRGTKKSLYYTVVSILLTLVLMFGISFVSITWFIKTPGALLDFVEKLKIPLSSTVREYLESPELNVIVFALADVVFKIVVFLVLYPIVKWLITKILFKTFWNATFEKGYYEKEQLNFLGQNVTIKAERKKINPLSRLFGGILGAFRGVVVSFVLLLPLIVVAGSVSQFESVNQNGETVNALNFFVKVNNDTNNNTEEVEFEEILKALQNINDHGLGAVTKKVRVGDKSIDEAMFDFAFSGSVKSPQTNEKVKIHFSQEINTLGQIAQVLIEDGYLDKDFDYKKINYRDNYLGIDQMLQSASNSELFNLVFAITLDLANENENLINKIGFKMSENVYTKDAFSELKKVSFKDDAESLSQTIKQALLLGSVGELIELSQNPKDVLNLTFNQKQQLAKILEEASELDLLIAGNIALEYLLHNEKILNKITWTDNPYEYLHQQLNFIFSNPRYFTSDNNEIKNISKLLSNVFSEEYKDFDYSKFLPQDGKFDAKFLLEEETSNLINTLLQDLVEVKTIVNAIPLGVDYAVYTSKNVDVNKIADDLSDLASDANFENEINNLSDVYKNIIKLGLGSFFEEEADLILVTDNLLNNQTNLEVIKLITKQLFETSEVVNEVLDLAAEPLVNNLIKKDDELKEFVLTVIKNENFKYGLEISNLIDITESFYKFTTLKEINAFADEKDNVSIIKTLSNLDQVEFEQFKANILKLQTLQFASKDALMLLDTKLNKEFIEIPENANYISLKTDLNLALDLAYEAAIQIEKHNITTNNLEDLNLALITKNSNLPEILTINDNNKDSVIVHSLVKYLQTNEIKLGEFGTFVLPEEFNLSNANSDLWLNEINNLIQGSLSLLNSFGNEDEQFVISINNIKSLNADNIPTHVITRFKDEVLLENSFTNLTQSELFKYNAINIVNEVLSKQKQLPDYQIDLSLYKDELLNKDNIIEALKVSVLLLDEFVEDHYLSINDNIKTINLEKAINTFNNLSNSFVVRLSQAKIYNESFRKVMV